MLASHVYATLAGEWQKIFAKCSEGKPERPIHLRCVHLPLMLLSFEATVLMGRITCVDGIITFLTPADNRANTTNTKSDSHSVSDLFLDCGMVSVPLSRPVTRLPCFLDLSAAGALLGPRHVPLQRIISLSAKVERVRSQIISNIPRQA